MIKQINFDMDGTIANFYGVENWLEYLMNEDAYPYAVAEPLLKMNVFARRLNQLQKNGYEICIISWLSKGGTAEYNAKVTKAKKQWLGTHLKSVRFDRITIVPYGTPKQTLGCGILFDDEKPNRDAWGNGAYDADMIMQVLNELA